MWKKGKSGCDSSLKICLDQAQLQVDPRKENGERWQRGWLWCRPHHWYLSPGYESFPWAVDIIKNSSDESYCQYPTQEGCSLDKQLKQWGAVCEQLQMEEFELGPDNPCWEIIQVQDPIEHSREANCASHERVNVWMLAAERAWPKRQ